MKNSVKKMVVVPGSIVEVWCDHPFVVYADFEVGESCMLGPRSHADQYLRFNVPKGCTLARLVTDPKAHVNVEYWHTRGLETPDPTPVEIPVGGHHPPSLMEDLKTFIRQEVSQQAQEAGLETFEEADDFDIDDDEEMITGYELHEMQEDTPAAAFESVSDDTTESPEGGAGGPSQKEAPQPAQEGAAAPAEEATPSPASQ